jgi:hydroxymethylglutaryl-CoA synthase
MAPPSSSRPSNVGILASYLHFPSTFVSQKSLEEFDGVSQNKYTLGLGQEQMAFCGPKEDTTSLMLTAVSELLSRYNLTPNDIGRLEVGTESLVDKSKSAKTSLMPLFNDNTSLEGVTSINACYGGTAALLHTVDWVESSAWDGRYGLVVCGDVAVYEKGPARPTGGAGVVALLVGPNAPLVLESKLRSTHMEDVYDFYKPKMDSEYPIVDGKLSNSCYLRSIDICFDRFASKYEKHMKKPFSLEKDVQHAIFHLPYTKLVQKSFARMAFDDARRAPQSSKYASKLGPFLTMNNEESYTNRDMEKAALEATAQDYMQKVYPSTLAGRRIGNIYTGSLYAGLCSLIAQSDDSIIGNRALMFSYGSGLAATLFSVKVTASLEEQRKACDLLNRLDARVEASAKDYTTAMSLREQEWSRPDFSPSTHPTERLQPGEYYLSKVDALHRRTYERTPLAASTIRNSARAFSTIARRLL